MITEMTLQEIKGVVTLVKAPVHAAGVFVFAANPKILAKVHRIFENGGPKAKVTLMLPSGDEEFCTIPVDSLRKLVILTETFSYVPSQRQIQWFRMYESVGKEVEIYIQHIS
jgi:hypothetical protein